MSATALAEYLILRPDRQDTVLHDSRFSRPPIVNAYAEAIRALRAYHCDRRRPATILSGAKGALSGRAEDPSLRPSARDEARRCVEAIQLFERSENALGMRQLSLEAPPLFAEMSIAGVAVSVQPDLLVRGTASNGEPGVGAAMFRVPKAPDPTGCRLDETRKRRGDHRRELAWYVIAMMDMLLAAQANSLGKADRNLCFVADIRLGERIEAASDHAARIRAINAACGQIARLWGTIQPRSSILAP
jgi:hypothetical protein